VRGGDYIVAVINQELVTAGEVDRRIDQAQAQAAQRRDLKRLPPAAELRQQALDALIEERVIITHARDSGVRGRRRRPRPRGAEHRAQNQLTLAAARPLVQADGRTSAAFAPTCATSSWSSACASARSTSASASPTASRPLVDQQRGSRPRRRRS
jgi:hypothetical protein